MATHILKIWPEYYEGLKSGNKKHEVRKDDRSFVVQDYIQFQEWDPKDQLYTGRLMTAQITWVTEGGNFGLPLGICVFSVVVLGTSQTAKFDTRWEPAGKTLDLDEFALAKGVSSELRHSPRSYAGEE